VATFAELTNVTYWYPGCEQPALRDVSLKVGPAEVILVVGASGSGKSTLLRCLNGLVPHFHGGVLSGRVEVGGKDTRTSRVHELAHLVGLVFQDPESQAVMTTVEREIAFGLENMGVPSQAISRLVEEALILLGLSHLRHASLATLSGGELQKVALAAVLATQPQLLLLDEPTSQLDPVSSEDLLAAIRRLSEDTGATIVLAEHRTERCLHLVTRVLYMDDGVLVADADPQLFARWALDRHRGLLPPVARLFARRQNPQAVDDGDQVLPMTVKDARHVLLAEEQPRPRRCLVPLPRSHGDTVLEVRRLAIGYDSSEPLLENLNFSLARGEAVALMGENGVGKSTLIRHFIGLARPLAGKILLLDRDVADLSVAAAARDCALMGQNPNDLFVKDTVAEEILFTLEALGFKGDECHVLTSRIVAELDLEALLERNPRDLSGGERTRVALAATVCGDPTIVVLDEPTRGMDSLHKNELSALVHRWVSAGRCVVLVTHDVEFAAKVAERVIVLGDRGLLADGSAADVLDGSLFFSTQINRLFRRQLPGVLREDEVEWGDNGA
jgi:energy-coupling factor transport system ATP-binding protein